MVLPRITQSDYLHICTFRSGVYLGASPTSGEEPKANNNREAVVVFYKILYLGIQYKSVDETLLFNLESENINTYSEIRKQHLGEISSFLQDVRPKGNVTLHPKRCL